MDSTYVCGRECTSRVGRTFAYPACPPVALFKQETESVAIVVGLSMLYLKTESFADTSLIDACAEGITALAVRGACSGAGGHEGSQQESMECSQQESLAHFAVRALAPRR